MFVLRMKGIRFKAGPLALEGSAEGPDSGPNKGQAKLAYGDTEYECAELECVVDMSEGAADRFANALSDATVMVTRDGGQTWAPPAPRGDATVMVTRDGGQTWAPPAPPAPRGDAPPSEDGPGGMAGELGPPPRERVADFLSSPSASKRIEDAPPPDVTQLTKRIGDAPPAPVPKRLDTPPGELVVSKRVTE